MVGSCGPALAGSARNTEISRHQSSDSTGQVLPLSPVTSGLLEGSSGLRLSDHTGLLGGWLGRLGTEYWGLLETSLGGSGLELLGLGLGLK